MVKFLKKERISKDYSQNFAKKRNFRLLFNGLVAGRVLGFKLSGICSRGALSSALIQPFHFDYLAFFQSSFSQRGYKNTFCRHSVPPSFFTALMRPREILSVPFAQFHKSHSFKKRRCRQIFLKFRLYNRTLWKGDPSHLQTMLCIIQSNP